MNPPRKLSLQVLADAFAREEGEFGGTVFAVIANIATLRVVTEFMRVMAPGSSPTNMWGALYIDAENSKVPDNELYLAVCRNGTPWPTQTDMTYIFKCDPAEGDPTESDVRWVRPVKLD